MRIIAGQWRRRSIEAPPGLETRPTSDRLRESLFSMLSSRLGTFEELRIADLFAGSGALGFEALSRGASHATFVENNARAAALIKRNGDTLGARERISVMIGSALSLQRSKPFDLIFADPPYSTISGTRVVRAVLEAGWLAPGGWLALETSRGDGVEPDALVLDSFRDFSRARLTLLRRL